MFSSLLHTTAGRAGVATAGVAGFAALGTAMSKTSSCEDSRYGRPLPHGGNRPPPPPPQQGMRRSSTQSSSMITPTQVTWGLSLAAAAWLRLPRSTPTLYPRPVSAVKIARRGLRHCTAY